jgi:hypothetical protein
MGGSLNIVLLVLVLVAALFAWFFIFSRILRIVVATVKALSSGRAGLNPRTNAGRLLLFGIASFIVAIVSIYQFRATLEDVGFNISAVGFLIVGIATAWLAFRCIVRAKRYDAPTATAVLSEDNRPPVVYLRSFGDDQKAANNINITGLSVNTEEGELAETVKVIGPLIAIGRPGEELSYFGAARVYVGDGDWHKQVGDLLSRAALVVLRAGTTPGLSWEIEQCCRRVAPERLVILIPLSQSAYDEFRDKAQGFFPCHLPEYDGRRIGVTTIRAILYFDADWTPHIRPIVQQSTAMYLARGAVRRTFLPWREANLQFFLGKQSEQRRTLEKALQPVLQRPLPTAPGPAVKAAKPRAKARRQSA